MKQRSWSWKGFMLGGVAVLVLLGCAGQPEDSGQREEGEKAIAVDVAPATPIPDVFAKAMGGGVCAPRSCTVGECGMVSDGCRAEMWCGECACAAGAMACERSATQLWEHVLSGPGTFTIIATAISPVTIDPVLHVIDATGVEYGFDDNSAGGTLPRATITVPSGQQRLVVMRPKTDSPTGGVATVQINGLGYIFGVRGRRQVFSNLRANEEIETVQLPPSTSTHTIYAMSADGEHIAARVSGNGTAGGAVVTQASAATSRVFWYGTGTAQSQPLRLLRNDRRLSGHDVENGVGDGLGSELETALGTCSALTGFAIGKDGVSFPCSNAVDARDTDGDGISDGNEVRGARTATPHQPLPRWGADPRHKDLFAEIDGAQVASTSEIPPKMTQAQARLFSDFYGDRARDLTSTEKVQHAATLRNPDGKPGIRTHLDIGLPAETSADATIYGDWGGYSFVPPRSPGLGADANEAWRSHLVTSRVAMFRYALMWRGFGGQTPTGTSACPGCGMYAWQSANDGGALSETPIHESAHANAMAHSGPAGIAPLVDPNCKANWPSVASYAFSGKRVGFADGTGMGTVNNARATEWNAVSPARPDTMTTLRTVFQYLVDPAGHVDWNRDGVFAAAGSTVRAYINYEPGNPGCEFTRYNYQHQTSQLDTQLSPALARLGIRMYLFSAGQNRLRYVSSSDSLDCAINANGCAAWGNYTTTLLDVTHGVDVARLSDGQGHEALLVVGIDAQGAANYQLMVLGPFGSVATTSVQSTQLWSTSTSEPALESLPDGRALLLFRQPNGNVMYGIFEYDGALGGAWMHGGDALKCGTSTVLTQKASASPGLAKVNLAGIGARVWALLSPATNLELKSFDAAALCFRDAELPLASAWNPAGRPVGVWVPDTSNALGGKLHIFGADANGDPLSRHLTQLWSYVDPIDGKAKIGQASGFDSGWANAYGIDAWHDPIDQNLRALWSMSPSLGHGDGQLNFYPRADGIIDFDQINYDDWVVLRYAVCRNVVNPRGDASNPISCPPRPW